MKVKIINWDNFGVFIGCILILLYIMCIFSILASLVYGLIIAFSASIILGIICCFIPPIFTIIGLVKFLTGVNLAIKLVNLLQLN